MERVYIFGHKNPDTDSVTSAISLSYLKNKLGMDTIPCILGEINNETKFVLNYFNVEKPVYLNDTKLQVKDLNYRRGIYKNEYDTLNSLYEYMKSNDITGVPICDNDNKYIGIVTMKDLLKVIIDPDYHDINTSYDNIINLINGKSVLRFDDEIRGKIVVSVYRSVDFYSNKLNGDDIVIVGNRFNSIDYAIKSKVKLIIVVGTDKISDDLLKEAKENKVNIMISYMDSYYISRMIILSNYIKDIVNTNYQVLIEENMYVNDLMVLANKFKYSNYPIVDKDNNILGLLKTIDINVKDPKKCILVDHNEVSQSVDGIEEAKILEIVDHHKIGNVNTSEPINFRNMAVGSTNTIIYQMYKENNIKPSKSIAGLMISGIISDTLLFNSPTTTDFDRECVDELVKICDINLNDYATSMFTAASSIKGKTIEEIIYSDFKSFYIKDLKVGISQITVINYKEILKHKDKYLKTIESISSEHDYNILAFLITDVINHNSYILFNMASKAYFENIFRLDDIKQGEELIGIVSRKKQIIPLLMEEIK